jgi:deoxycytidylate deaminase
MRSQTKELGDGLVPILHHFGVETERQLILDVVLLYKKHGLLGTNLLHIMLRLCLINLVYPVNDSDVRIAVQHHTPGKGVLVKDTVDRISSIQGAIFSFLNPRGGTNCVRHQWAMQLWPSVRESAEDRTAAIVLILNSCVELATGDLACLVEAQQTAEKAFTALTEQEDHIRTILRPDLLDAVVDLVQRSTVHHLPQQPAPGLDFFMQAAAAATRGNQHGSKHGAVLVHNGRAVTTGFNHWIFDFKKKKRVVHAEVHALVNFFKQSTGEGSGSSTSAGSGSSTSEEKSAPLYSRLDACIHRRSRARGGAEDKKKAGVWSIWIVELAAHGLGYESAHPCPQCNKALMSCGVSVAHFSTTAGARQRVVNHNPGMVCESLQIALQSECK